MLTNSSSLNSSSCIFRVSWMVAMPAFLRSGQLFLLSAPWHLFHISLPASSLRCRTFVCVGQCPFVIIHFYKMSPELSTGRQNGITATHFTVCVCLPDTQWPITDRLQTVTWQLMYLLFRSWFVDGRASSKICTLFSYSQLIYCGN